MFDYFWVDLLFGGTILVIASCLFVFLRDDEGFWPSIGPSLGMGAIAFVVLIVAMAIGDLASYEVVKTDAQYSLSLENLNDGVSAHGGFFLGSGSINSEPAYMYYVYDHGRYKLKHADADDSYVIYTDGKPTVVVHYKRSGNRFWSRLNDKKTDLTYEFRVPRGSITTDFRLDAQ